MKNPSRISGYTLAAAAAGLFAAMAANTVLAQDKPAAEQATVKCENSSACKGQGSCKTAKNECKGHNGCKAQGLTMQKSAAECKKAQEAAKKS